MLQTRSALVWALVAVMAALTLVSLALTGLSVDILSNPGVFALIGILLALTWFYSAIRPDLHLKIATEAFCQVLLILLLGILLTYAAAAASASFPYSDPHLAQLDLTLGFERQFYLDFFGEHLWLRRLTSLAYRTLLPQFAIVPAILLTAGRVSRMHAWLAAVAVTLVATSAISIYTPSVTAFVYSDLKLNVPSGVYTPMAAMQALRAGTFGPIRLDNLEGLVSFPSFHTAAGMLFVWALWPLRLVRWTALSLNAALIAATPIEGAHYLVDLAGGAAIASAAVVVSLSLCRRLPVAEKLLGSPIGEPKSRSRISSEI